jgi:hypothetical protein
MKAFSAGDTIFFPNGLHMRRKPMLCHFEDIGSRHIHACLNTAEAHDTPIKPLLDQRGSIRKGGKFSFLWKILIFFDPKFVSAVLKLAFSSSITDRAIQRMVDQ